MGRRNGILLFWAGSLLVTLGVAFHFPDYLAACRFGCGMAGMRMSGLMLWGMAFIAVGLALAGYGLAPRRPIRLAGRRPSVVWRSDARLTWRHWLLFSVLMLALVIDMMKPTLLGFVAPGVAKEYGLSRPQVAWLPFCGLSGTALGSFLWGGMADLMGRRASILLAALVFIGTSICGAMPSFGWNLSMCFFMGLGVGGMLPVTLTLLAETTPPKHRGWLLVLLGGVGAFGGYVAASGSAAWLEPLFGWRVLWLVGMPTGILLIALNRFIPESPGYLIRAGFAEQAAATAARFGGRLDTALAPSASQSPLQRTGLRSTVAVAAAGVVSGYVNFGFLLWLPAELRRAGASVGMSDQLILASSLVTLPVSVVAAWAYARFGGRVVLFILMAMLAAASFGLSLMGGWTPGNQGPFIVLVALVMIGNGGGTAVLLPYAIQTHTLAVRGTAAGGVAGATKAGGIGAQVLSLAAAAPTSSGLVAPALLAGLGILWVGRRVGRTAIEDQLPDDHGLTFAESG